MMRRTQTVGVRLNWKGAMCYNRAITGFLYCLKLSQNFSSLTISLAINNSSSTKAKWHRTQQLATAALSCSSYLKQCPMELFWPPRLIHITCIQTAQNYCNLLKLFFLCDSLRISHVPQKPNVSENGMYFYLKFYWPLSQLCVQVL